jgi:hypothetical protein
MRHRILIALFALGTIGGFASGFHSLRHRGECRRSWMEERASRTCTPCPTSAEAPSAPSTQAPPPAEPR